MIRDHTESLQILQIHSSMLVLLLFSSPHSFSVGFRSEDRDSHGKRFILCSVTHFCVYFDVCFGLLSWWKIQTWPIIRFLTEAVTNYFFYLLVFDRIHDAMHLNKMFRTSGMDMDILSLFVLNSSGGFAAKKIFFQFHFTIEASAI